MKYIWQIMTLLLAAVVLLLSIDGLKREATPSEPTVDKEQVVLDAIMTRSSVRQYTDKQVTAAQVETLLRAGMAAPTAGNRQPWEFYVVTDRDIIRQFTKVTKYSAPMNELAQTAIVVCGDPSRSFPDSPEYWVQDCSAATENILLAAHGIGLGAVWCGVFPGLDRVAALRELLNIPENLIPLNIIMVGNPAVEANVKDKWKPERVRYVK